MTKSGRNDRQAQKKKLRENIICLFNDAESALRDEWLSTYGDYDDRSSCNIITIMIILPWLTPKLRSIYRIWMDKISVDGTGMTIVDGTNCFGTVHGLEEDVTGSISTVSAPYLVH
jgi:hypothetical protein